MIHLTEEEANLARVALMVASKVGRDDLRPKYRELANQVDRRSRISKLAQESRTKQTSQDQRY